MTRQESADATALVARLIAANADLVGQDLLDLRRAVVGVAEHGPRFGAGRAALDNVCTLLPGFEGRVHQTKTELAAAIGQFINDQVQAGEQPGIQQQQQPVIQQQQPGALGTAEWRQGLIRDLLAAQRAAPNIQAPPAAPVFMSDTDSESPGFHSYLAKWLDMEFEGAEEDLVPLLRVELERVGSAQFQTNFGDDEGALIMCRRELPSMLRRPYLRRLNGVGGD
jgi:hypothetical protein